ncbi:LuxR family transcriptional regulator, partial [Chryseobacterium cucumeris]
MEIREQLSDQLLDSALKKCQLDLEIYKQRALAYSQMEGAICVLSDMQENKSFIYKSAAADELGLKMEENPAEIDSIWEEDMLKKIHPDDRLKKYIHELRFFKLLETMEIEERTAYSVVSKIRMKDKNEDYRWVKHRMFYIYSPDNGRLRLALCLYNIALTSSGAPDFMIVNVIKGEVVVKDKLDYKNILSPRELEVLK